jgi:hypothetical protein
MDLQAKTPEIIGIRILNSLNIPIYQESGWMVSGKVIRQFDLPDLPAGVYFMELKRNESNSLYKILIQR